MDTKIIIAALISFLQNHGAVSGDEQEYYDHIARRRQQSSSLVDNFVPSRRSFQPLRRSPSSYEFRQFLQPYRRSSFDFDPHEIGSIIGAPSLPSHLPQAEPILPGHTLVRPAMGMLKSAVKFPHRELENGFGVLGNWKNLGIRWDGKNERVLYTGFRRMPAEYLMVAPSRDRNRKNPSFTLSNLFIDLDDDKDVTQKIVKRLKALKKRKRPAKRSTFIVILSTPEKEKSPRSQKVQKKHSKKYKYPSLEEYLQYLFSRNNENPDLSKMVKNKPNILRTVKEDDSTKELVELPSRLKQEDKKHWIWQNTELFNTIGQNSIAVPDLTQINLPIGQHHEEQVRPWWYFNQDDFRPFLERSGFKLYV